MYKLVFVGSGSGKRLSQYIGKLQSEFKNFIDEYNFRIYDLDKLWKTKSSVDLLNKCSRLHFSTAKYGEKTYLGINNDINLEEFHSRWFSLNPIDWQIPRDEYYSKVRFRTLIKQFANSAVQIDNFRSYDFEIKYSYIHFGSDLCIIEWRLNENLLCPNPLKMFQEIVTTLDESFPDVFLSAYSENFCGNPDKDGSLFIRYDYSMIESKILDIGYMFYISKSIENKNSFLNRDDFLPYTAKCLNNGTQYTLELQDESNHTTIHNSHLKSLLIPKYYVVNWDQLCLLETFDVASFDTVSMYHDRYSPTNPTLVFSFGYAYDQIDNLTMLHGLVLQERWNLEEVSFKD